MKRRNFIKSIPYVTLPSVLGGHTFRALGSSSMLNALLSNYVDTDKVLVIIQLSGGNDGINMVLPLDQYSGLSALRSNILIPESKALKLQDRPETGLHPAMTGMFDLYKDGKLNVVQAVSYPSPDFSHFRATDIWLTGADSNQVLTSGWTGRYLANEFPNYPVGYPNATMPDPLAIQIGSVLSPAFQSVSINMGIAITSTDNFYNLLNGVQDPAPNNYYGKELTYVRTMAQQTQKYFTSIKTAADKVKTQVTYPNNYLASQLKIVARLIAGGLKTRVYMVSMGGFDTHSAQVNTTDTTTGSHANLLGQLSSAVKAFMDDLAFLKSEDRVVGMTFSEFGRRIKSNGSVGTDHGAAAPLFVFGSNVKGGVTGKNPVITANMTVNDNVPMQYDFRSVYASILQNWFCLPAADLQKVMLKNYQQLPLINNVCSRSDSEAEAYKQAGLSIVDNYPNPFMEVTTIRYDTQGGHTMVQIFNNQGQEVKTLVETVHESAGRFEVRCDLEGLPAGTYYVRLQNESLQQVKAMIKSR